MQAAALVARWAPPLPRHDGQHAWPAGRHQSARTPLCRRHPEHGVGRRHHRPVDPRMGGATSPSSWTWPRAASWAGRYAPPSRPNSSWPPCTWRSLAAACGQACSTTPTATPICKRRLSSAARRARHHTEHEPRRQLLGQCAAESFFSGLKAELLPQQPWRRTGTRTRRSPITLKRSTTGGACTPLSPFAAPLISKRTMPPQHDALNPVHEIDPGPDH